MVISATLVRELRERTGAGMMECKQALVEAAGDIEAAIEAMRKAGQAKAAKKAGRTAAEGLITIKLAENRKTGVLLEINCETDFVAKDENFQNFANIVTATALNGTAQDNIELSALQLLDDATQTINNAREELIAKIGENIQIRRLLKFNDSTGILHQYRHGIRIGVLVEIIGGDDRLGRDIAMHIAASNPLWVQAEQIPAEILAKEREIFRAQSLSSGKPESIIEKMVEGRLRKYLAELTLMGQPFVKNPEQSVAQVLAQAKAQVIRFARIEVGEGIEKKTTDFAAEVSACGNNK